MPRPPQRRSPGLAIALVVTAACSVTWRQPEIKPLNPTRQYPATVAAACGAVIAALQQLDMVVDDAQGAAAATEGSAAAACLVQTEHRRLPESGDSFNYLDKVAYVGPADFFSHGRVAVTTSVRAAAGELTRVRLTTRIEGYDAGYRLLRSRGLIEEALFARIEQMLDVSPVQ